MSEKIFTADEFALLDVNHLEIHKFTLTIDGKVAVRVVGGTSSGGGGDMYKVENLSGLANYAVARSNLSVYSITQIDTLFSGYYTETETDTLLGGKANTSHTHTTTDITNLSSYTGFDSRYYTETETDTLLGGKANTSHTHTTTDITNLSSYTGFDSRYYTETETNTLLSGKSDTSHNHSGVYEPIFSKNTAFNKNFGTTTGTVLEGNANLGLVGTKEVDEVAIGNGKILSYNSTSGKLEYIVLGSGGDMLASIYDPAGGARQVAFANQLFSGAYADLSGKPTLGTMSAENTTSYYNKTELDNLFNLKLNKALTQLDSVNLNTIIDNGFYCANSNCTNLPETSIKTRLRVNKDPSNSDLAMQEALTTTTLVSYVRTTANGGTTWTSWTRIKATDETKQTILAEGAFVDGDKTKLDNQSGVNTGDNSPNKNSGLVHTTGNETIGDVKTFSSSPIVPTPTTDYQAATKEYVDNNAGGGGKQHRITIPGELIADTSNYQGLYFYNDTGATITISNVAIAVGNAAAGSGAACAINIYKSSGTASHGLNTSAVNLFTTDINLGTGYTSLTNVPNTATVETGRWVTLRVTSSAGATNKANDLQCILTYS